VSLHAVLVAAVLVVLSALVGTAGAERTLMQGDAAFIDCGCGCCACTDWDPYYCDEFSEPYEWAEPYDEDEDTRYDGYVYDGYVYDDVRGYDDVSFGTTQQDFSMSLDEMIEADQESFESEMEALDDMVEANQAYIESEMEAVDDIVEANQAYIDSELEALDDMIEEELEEVEELMASVVTSEDNILFGVGVWDCLFFDCLIGL